MIRSRVALLLTFAIALLPMSSHALYDPPPAAALASVEGAWQGTLQYRDYQPPYKRVTLPVRLFVAASSPRELALHYVFNDGPGKTVHSYDRIALDLDAGTVRFSGLKPEHTSVVNILSRKSSADMLELVAERTEESKGEPKVVEVVRYRIRLGAAAFEVLKTAGPAGAEGEFKNEYVFRR